MISKLTGCLLTLFSLTASAQSDSVVSSRITTSSQMIGVGGSNILDTYLSQEKFRGVGISFLSMVERRKPERRWSTVMEHQAHFSYTHDRGRTAKELEGSYAFFWGKFYRWSLFHDRLQLQAGGLLNVGVGFIYNTVNSNNPAQARVHLLPTVQTSSCTEVRDQPTPRRYHVQPALRTVLLRNLQQRKLRP